MNLRNLKIINNSIAYFLFFKKFLILMQSKARQMRKGASYPPALFFVYKKLVAYAGGRVSLFLILSLNNPKK
jgi:hypothetical protein